MRSFFPIAGVAVILLAAGMLLNRFYTDATFLPPDDFLQYWAAGQLNATGGNPYDATALLDLQRAAGRPADRPAVLMWNPPWVLTLAMPFGLLPARTAQLLWLVIQFAILIGTADRLWSCFGGDRRMRPVVCGLSLALYPVMFLTFAGQSSGWLLLGLVGLLSSGSWRSALLIPFLAVKPHLFVPLWIVLGCEAARTKRGRIALLIGASVGLVAAIIPTIANPDVWRQYFEAMNRPMDAAHSPLSGWKSPLIGYWVRAALAPESFWIQAVPTVLTAIAVPIYWWSRRQDWNWNIELPRLVIVGLIASPYGAWPYDQIVLLVPVVDGCIRLIRTGSHRERAFGFLTLLAINVAALTMHEGEWFVWPPPAIALWYGWSVSRGFVREPRVRHFACEVAGAC
jgi:hypothetical protein